MKHLNILAITKPSKGDLILLFTFYIDQSTATSLAHKNNSIFHHGIFSRVDNDLGFYLDLFSCE